MGDESDLILVVQFNSYTGRLQGGYMMDDNGQEVGKDLSAAEVLAHLVAYPETRCLPERVYHDAEA
jgi:hypothetical protein